MVMPLPRYVRPRRLAGGQIGYYWIVPTHFRRLGCTIPNEPLVIITKKRVERTALADALLR
jgi:hypothetical protein